MTIVFPSVGYIVGKHKVELHYLVHVLAIAFFMTMIVWLRVTTIMKIALVMWLIAILSLSTISNAV